MPRHGLVSASLIVVALALSSCGGNDGGQSVAVGVDDATMTGSPWLVLEGVPTAETRASLAQSLEGARHQISLDPEQRPIFNDRLIEVTTPDGNVYLFGTGDRYFSADSVAKDLIVNDPERGYVVPFTRDGDPRVIDIGQQLAADDLHQLDGVVTNEVDLAQVRLLYAVTYLVDGVEVLFKIEQAPPNYIDLANTQDGAASIDGGELPSAAFAGARSEATLLRWEPTPGTVATLLSSGLNSTQLQDLAAAARPTSEQVWIETHEVAR